MNGIDRAHVSLAKEVIRHKDGVDTSSYVMTPEDFAEKYGDRSKLRQLEFGRGINLLIAMDNDGSEKEKDDVERYICIVFLSKCDNLDYLKAKEELKIKELEKKYRHVNR